MWLRVCCCHRHLEEMSGWCVYMMYLERKESKMRGARRVKPVVFSDGF